MGAGYLQLSVGRQGRSRRHHGFGGGQEGRSPKPAAPATEPPKPDGVVVYPEQTAPVSASERAILERLQSRRQELEARAREIDIRESLLKSAEKRIESKVEEMKAVESRISTASGAKERNRGRPLQGHHHHV